MAGLNFSAPTRPSPPFRGHTDVLESPFRNLIYIEEFRRGQTKAPIFEAPPFKMHYAGRRSTIGRRDTSESGKEKRKRRERERGREEGQRERGGEGEPIELYYEVEKGGMISMGNMKHDEYKRKER